ncbi:hypothetical protein ACHAPT_011207 [Fusarium lateritium]
MTKPAEPSRAETSEMLKNYLSNDLTITERLALLSLVDKGENKVAHTAVDSRKDIRELLVNWQDMWDKKKSNQQVKE